MKIEVVKNNVVLINTSNENFEIHPLWLRERAKTEKLVDKHNDQRLYDCLLYTSPSPRDVEESRMPSSA